MGTNCGAAFQAAAGFPAGVGSRAEARGRLKCLPHSSQRGFTLVELIISITLVSLISVGMLTAMRTSLMTLDKTRARLDDNRRTAGLEQMMTRQLGGAMPVMGNCATSAGLIGQVPIFSGTPQSLDFVSSYSMAEGSRGYPRFLAYQVVPEDGGTVKLVVNEHLFSGPASTLPFCLDNVFPPAPLTPDSFVLAERLAYCRISYRERNQGTQFGGDWVQVWTRPELPVVIRIEMLPAVPDTRRLALVGVTVPLHVTRRLDLFYDEK